MRLSNLLKFACTVVGVKKVFCNFKSPKTSLSALFNSILCMLLFKNAFIKRWRNIDKGNFYSNPKLESLCLF